MLMRVAIGALIGLLFTGVVIAQGDVGQKDLAMLQGRWTLAFGERDGKTLSEQTTNKTKILFEGQDFDYPDPAGIVTSRTGTIKLNPSKNPKWIDSTSTTDNAKEELFLAICELSEDRCRACFSPPGKPRPTDFSSKSGSGHIYQVWKRADADAIVGSYTMLSGEMNRNKLSEQTVDAASLTIQGDTHITKVGDETITGTLRFDATKYPKEIDVAHAADIRHMGKTSLGIYKLENGVFTVCFAPPGKDRPKEFTTKSGTGEVVHVWKKK